MVTIASDLLGRRCGNPAGIIRAVAWSEQRSAFEDLKGPTLPIRKIRRSTQP